MIRLSAFLFASAAISEILAIGDSYTAGIGSNGLPDRIEGSFDCSRYDQAWPLQLQGKDDWSQFNGDTHPVLTFGACTGHKMDDLVKNQLKQGDPNPNLEFTNIGKPQISVLTISGNDAEFGDAVNDCILRAWLPGDCDQRLTGIGNKINDQPFKNQLIQTLVQVIAAGRQAKGANPPEAFQVYIAGYVGFWNHDNPACDDVSFGYWWFSKPKLTRDLRKRMNDLVDQLNGVIREVAASMDHLGVFYVDGFQSAYDTHRFCEPPDGPDYLAEPIGKKTWFWHHLSPNLIGGGEGPDGTSTAGLDNRTQEILDYLMPDKAQQAAISESNPPWNSDAFESEDAFYSALAAAIGNDTDVHVNLDEGTRRIFHPKGSAYTPYADAFLAAIRANRDPVNAASPTPTVSPTPSPTAAPYATGTCSFHLDEYEAPCLSDANNLSADIVLKDNAGTEIGNTGGNKGINAGSSLSLSSKLPSQLVVTGEHQGDYVQFTYGDLSWTNGEPKKDDGGATLAYCNSGGWDPKEGPTCGRITQNSKRQMDCFFRC
ncbi:putative esterase family protein [Neofusicoccum parvum]|uniref:Esterase family protein n=1 Tax=Neofusicoccum parvum TaxID=310453 RepID=A0ACB5S870_9PEZI|nr:putative esterase family protein [Neofusicoccum parvum]